MKGAKKQIRQNVYLAFEGTFQLIEKEKNRIQNSVVILEQEYMEKYMQYTVGDLAGSVSSVRSEYIEKKTSLENQMKELVLSEKQSRKQRREQKKMFDIWEQFYNEKN